MAKLYELKEEYETILCSIDDYIDEDGIISPKYLEMLNGIQDNIKTKATSVASYVKSLLAEEAQYAQEIKRLTANKNRIQKQIEFYKNYLTNALLVAEIDTIQDVKANISFRTAERLEIDEKAVIPKKYQVATFKPDKVAIKLAISQGKKVKGCQIIQTKNIQIN